MAGGYLPEMVLRYFSNHNEREGKKFFCLKGRKEHSFCRMKWSKMGVG